MSEYKITGTIELGSATIAPAAAQKPASEFYRVANSRNVARPTAQGRVLRSNYLRKSFTESRAAGLGGGDPRATTGGGLGGGDPRTTTGGGLGGGDPRTTTGGGLGGDDPRTTTGGGLGGDPRTTTGGGLGGEDARDQFKLQHQGHHSEWCWAAVAASVEKYFDPSSALTQCQIAREVFQRQGINAECCTKGTPCNQEERLTDALTIPEINRLKRTYFRALTFEEVQKEIDAGRPVCARIKWDGFGAHFVVLTGYEILRSGDRHVHVEDPAHPSSIVEYEEFRDAYYTDGTWVETYTVRESSKNF